MNQFREVVSRIGNDRPISLVLTSALWAVQFFVKAVWILRHWSLFPYPFLMLALAPLVQLLLLWSYWNGYSWARYLVLIVSSLELIAGLIRLPALLHLTTTSKVESWRTYSICASVRISSHGSQVRKPATTSARKQDMNANLSPVTKNGSAARANPAWRSRRRRCKSQAAPPNYDNLTMPGNPSNPESKLRI